MVAGLVALAAVLACGVAATAARAADTTEGEASEAGAAVNLAELRLLDPGALRLSLEGRSGTVNGLRPRPVQGGLSTSLVDVSNRVWLGWGRAAFGVGFGVQALQVEPVSRLSDAAAWQPSRPSVSVGWRYRVTGSSQLYAAATAARPWGSDDELPRYNAKAGVEWKVAKSRFGFDGGRLGVQLDSGYRMSIRTRSGGVQLALRRTF
ncbi:MAG TPA: hypothetical protein VFR90_06680 [Methylibium sp.]|uniref:hypothetical protein n=1 Tax=Methylibium sp. TaxID=2067992 RepID=UPI002DB928E2|nr:hypothetical protein [Methylibium sp.]HEU4458791.1 hypothetical protein [Methylibium sp.]